MADDDQGEWLNLAKAAHRLGWPRERLRSLARRGKIRTMRGNAGQLLVLRPKSEIIVAARAPARLMLLGGAPLDEPRHIWWNFVSSAPERIEAAKADWQARRFPAVPGDTEFTPLPE